MASQVFCLGENRTTETSDRARTLFCSDVVEREREREYGNLCVSILLVIVYTRSLLHLLRCGQMSDQEMLRRAEEEDGEGEVRRHGGGGRGSYVGKDGVDERWTEVGVGQSMRRD